MVSKEPVGATGPAQNEGAAENAAATETQPATAENTKSEKSSPQKKSTRRTRKKPDASPAEPDQVQPTPTQAAAPPKKKKWYKNPVPIILLLGAFLVIGGLIYFIGSKSGGTEVIVEQKDPNHVPLQQAPGTAIVFGQQVRTDLENYRKQQGATDVYTFVSGEPWKLVVNGGTQFRNRYYGDGVIEIMDGKGKVRDLVDGMRMDGNQFINVYMRVKPNTGASMTYEVTSSGPVTQPTFPASPSPKEYVLKVQNNKTGKSVSYAFGKK